MALPAILIGVSRLALGTQRFRSAATVTTGIGVRSNVVRVPTIAAQQQQNKKRLRELASSLASKANKRVRRLEKNGFTDQSAYRTYVESGGKFSVKGKNEKEILAELERVKKFLGDESSTVSGINKQAESVAKRLNIKYKTFKELREKNQAIFKLLPKITEYMKMSSNTYTEYDSDQVIDEVTDYVDEVMAQLKDGETLDIEQAIQDIEQRIIKLDKKSISVKRSNIPSFYKP
ncbi:MAG: hypothetical protein [Podoviridae sp. ctdc61]|nr:MAG: hypothetical protein [Podoviridae sp. ctdc61]